MKICRICGRESEIMPTGVESRGYQLGKCSNCHTEMTLMIPSEQELKKAYDKLFEKGQYTQHRDEFESLKKGIYPPNFDRWLILMQIGLFSKSKRMVEIGGGTGAFGMLARRAGWNYTDYDISEKAVDYARRLGLDAHCLKENELPSLDEESVDAVVMWEVIEHLPSPSKYIRWIRKILKRNGTFVCSTPNFSNPDYHRAVISKSGSDLSVPPIHINFFTKESLSMTLKACGFTKVIMSEKKIYRPLFRRKNIEMLFGFKPSGTIAAIAK